MKVTDFDYNLPQNLIAQTPIINREKSRLLVLNRNNGLIKHEMFENISNYLQAGDVLVLNNTKVIPARLIGFKKTGAKIELLLIKEEKTAVWECLVKPFKRIEVGTEVFFGDLLKAKCVAKKDEGIALFTFFYEGEFANILEKLGQTPLPPYITEKLAEKERYQTVYAQEWGSIAAPTAGLHFTDKILKELREKGIKIVMITLHVGIGTFRPVTVLNIKEHKMHDEFFFVSEEVVSVLNNCQGRIIGVGTTVVRTLESIYEDKFVCKSGFTDLFIYPGYQFRAIDMMITNFHLPKSTLLMMVSAFSKREFVLEAYREAVSRKYRFFSFGDAMLIK